jgi:nucleoside-diphosphate-sugar epimerase
MRLLILGGNRFIGAELVKQSIEKGHDVTVLALDKPSSNSARWLKANRNASLSRTFLNRAFDSVIDNIAFRAQHVTSLIDALRGRVSRYVLTSSVDIYCNRSAKFCDELDDERLLPCLHSDNIPRWEAYLRGKRACEVALRNSPHFEKVVVRPAVVIGARDNILCPTEGPTSRAQFFPLRITDGGPIVLRHTDVRLHQMAYVGDVAKALLLAATHPQAAGQVLNVVGDEVWTNERLIYALSRSLGHHTDVLRVSNSQLETEGLVNYETPYYRSFMNSWSLFSNKRLKGLGWNPTPVEVWGPRLFCFPHSLVKDIAQQRQKELRLARKILNNTPVSATFRLEGKFLRGEQAISSVGIGTHRGSESLHDDHAYFAAIKRAVRSGINVIDTAINYRCMRSEQVVGKAIQSLAVEGTDGGLHP